MATSPYGEIESALAAWLAEGRTRIGQVAIRSITEGGFSLCHEDDRLRDDLTDADDALAIALNDDADAYRPLKTAPNLRHGWRLAVPDLPALRLVLDTFYPGRLGAFLQWQAGQLAATPLRETLGRQTGMYRVAGRLTDEQAAILTGRFCRTDGGCLRAILWRLQDPNDAPFATLPPEKFRPEDDQAAIPLLCQEACNLYVAAARETVKAKP